MSGLKIEILHLPEVQQVLKDKAARLLPAFNKAASTARRLLVAELTKYPAPPSGSRYTRTFALKRGWERATPITGGQGFQLINAIGYASFVQGDSAGGGQASAHQGRWETAASIAHRLQEEVMAEYEAAVKEALQ